MDENELQPAGHIDTDDKWRERRRILLKNARVYDRLDELIAGAKTNQVSLAVFKPARVTDFIWEAETREWDPDKLREMRELTSQFDLFADNSRRTTFQVIPKLRTASRTGSRTRPGRTASCRYSTGRPAPSTGTA